MLNKFVNTACSNVHKKLYFFKVNLDIIPSSTPKSTEFSIFHLIFFIYFSLFPIRFEEAVSELFERYTFSGDAVQ